MGPVALSQPLLQAAGGQFCAWVSALSIRRTFICLLPPSGRRLPLGVLTPVLQSPGLPAT